MTGEASASPVAAKTRLKEQLEKLRRELDLALSEGTDGRALGVLHARGLDRLVAEPFEAAMSRAQLRGRAASAPPVVLAAAGSYGRGAVAMRSDADLCFVTASGGAARRDAEAIAEATLYPLWDAGLSVGHQVLGEDEAVELAHADLPTATALLDLRFVAGDAPRLDALRERAWRGLFNEAALPAFFARLEEERTARHARFGGSVYLLEPDVKSGAGGQRDLDAAHWIVRARFKVSNAGASGATRSAWQELVQLGVLVTREAVEIEAAEELLWKVRNRLHAHAGRRSDRLSFEAQETIALELGYGKASEERATAAERFMQDYYLKARAVTRARERLMNRAMPARRRGRPLEVELGDGVRLFDGQVSVAVAELAADPALALRMYKVALRENAQVLPFARDEVARAAADPHFCARLRESKEAADTFVELICSVPDAPTRRGSIAGELHDVGLLLAMVPEFQPVTGRVHHDVYHVYTVDVHSVAAVDALRGLARGELAQEYPLATRLAAEIARPRPLFLATLLHDVGKGYPDASGSRKNHSQSGAEICDHLLPRLGFTPAEVAHTRLLVSQHLTMYHTATRRDLDDPATVDEFSRVVGNREALRDLYLLTIVDITTTSPTAMNSWKARMLDELYFATDEHLSQLPSDARPGRGRALDEAAERELSPEARDFLRSMPERYALSHPVDSIVEHAAVARARGDRPVHAALVPSRRPEVAELCVVASDRPGLLARIAAAITAGRLEVLAAQVYSRTPDATAEPTDAEAVDLFWVRDRSDGAPAVERAMPRLLRDLDEVAWGGEGSSPTTLLRRARVGSASRVARAAQSPAVLIPTSSSTTARHRSTHRRRGLRQGPTGAPLHARPRVSHPRPQHRHEQDQHRGGARGRRLLRRRARWLEDRGGRAKSASARCAPRSAARARRRHLTVGCAHPRCCAGPVRSYSPWPLRAWCRWWSRGRRAPMMRIPPRPRRSSRCT